jgi:rubrerythrin
MDLKENQIKMIEMMAGNEETISKLYKTYAEKFPAHKEFWSQLAEEELEHADWIDKFYSQVKEGSVHFNEKRFTIEAIESLRNVVNNELARVQKEDIALLDALCIALDIENALVENKFFEVFEGDSVKLKHLFIELADGTNEHRDRIKKALDKNR